MLSALIGQWSNPGTMSPEEQLAKLRYVVMSIRFRKTAEHLSCEEDKGRAINSAWAAATECDHLTTENLTEKQRYYEARPPPRPSGIHNRPKTMVGRMAEPSLKMKKRKDRLQLRLITIRMPQPLHMTTVIRIIPMRVPRQDRQQVIIRNRHKQETLLRHRQKTQCRTTHRTSTLRRRRSV